MKIEEIMAQVAYSQIMQAMPAIREYILGFEMIDADENANRGLGVLLAKVGSTYLFIPSIYKNGRMCDMDTMYDPSNDRFLPVQDNTLSYLLSHKTDAVAVDVERPSIGRGGRSGGAGGVSLSLPFTMFSKVASTGNVPKMLKIAGGVMAQVYMDHRGSFEDLYDSINDISAPRLAKVAGAEMSEDLLSKLDTPSGYNAFARFYSEEDLNNLIDELANNVAIDRVNHAAAVPDAQTEPVKVITSASVEARDLSDVEKASILRDGAVIVDNRGLTPSKIYKVKQNSDWQTPSYNGLYELLKLDGSTLTAYVINLNAAIGLDKFTLAEERYGIIPVDDGMSRRMHIVDFAPLGQYYPMEASVPPGGVAVESLTGETFNTSGMYILVTTPTGDSMMFSKIWDTGGNYPHWVHTDEDIFTGIKLRPTELIKYVDANVEGRALDDKLARRIQDKLSPMPMVSAQNELVRQIIVGKPGSRMQLHGNTLRVPEGSKIYNDEVMDGYEDGDSLDLVDQSNALDAISRRDELIAVDIFTSNGLVHLSDKMSKKASGSKIDVAKALVHDYAVSPLDAMHIVKEACAKEKGESYLIKIAASAGFGMAFTQEQPNIVDYVETGRPNPHSSRTIKDSDVLERASDAGVRQVLDVQLLKLLSQDDGSVREVQQYIPRLMGAVDALGRLLFLTRVNESMQKAYGDQRSTVMEKSIKKTFVELWDIIIGLQQGRVDDISELLGGDVSQSLG